jgi:hypothetical protein
MPDNTYRTPTPGPLGFKAFAADWNGSVTTQPFTLITEAGVRYWLFIDSTGDLRIKATTAPTSDTDGTVVGTQS